MTPAQSNISNIIRYWLLLLYHRTGLQAGTLGDGPTWRNTVFATTEQNKHLRHLKKIVWLCPTFLVIYSFFYTWNCCENVQSGEKQVSIIRYSMSIFFAWNLEHLCVIVWVPVSYSFFLPELNEKYKPVGRSWRMINRCSAR